jgi:hypothetical protein
MVDPFCFGGDLHPLSYRRRTGGDWIPDSFNFHHAQSAGADGGQIGMMAKVRDINSGVKSGIKQARSFRRFDVVPVYSQGNGLQA